MTAHLVKGGVTLLHIERLDQSRYGVLLQTRDASGSCDLRVEEITVKGASRG